MSARVAKKTRTSCEGAACLECKHRSFARLEDMINHYIREHRVYRRREKTRCRRQTSLGQAIEIAAMSVTECGDRHPHQHRISKRVLMKARREIVSKKKSLAAADDFEKLHETVCDATRDISGIGPLASYDFAVRIGYFRGVEPKKWVYLHAGAKEGARKLGLTGQEARVDAFGETIRRLSAGEIEDFLCIFKKSLDPSMNR